MALIVSLLLTFSTSAADIASLVASAEPEPIGDVTVPGYELEIVNEIQSKLDNGQTKYSFKINATGETVEIQRVYLTNINDTTNTKIELASDTEGTYSVTLTSENTSEKYSIHAEVLPEGETETEVYDFTDNAQIEFNQAPAVTAQNPQIVKAEFKELTAANKAKINVTYKANSASGSLYWSENEYTSAADIKANATKLEDITNAAGSYDDEKSYAAELDFANAGDKEVFFYVVNGEDLTDSKSVSFSYAKMPVLNVTPDGYTLDTWTNSDVVLSVSINNIGKVFDPVAIYCSEGETALGDDKITTEGTVITDGTYTVTCEDNDCKDTNVYFYAVDSIGRIAKSEAQKVKINKKKPTLTATPDSYTVGTVTNNDVKISLSGTGSTTGVTADAFYYTDDATLAATTLSDLETKASKTDGSEFTVTCGEGETLSKTYYFFAVDSAGNVSERKSVEVKIDKKAPKLTLNARRVSWDGKDDKGEYTGEGWTGYKVKLTASATDSGELCDDSTIKYYYSVGGDPLGADQVAADGEPIEKNETTGEYSLIVSGETGELFNKKYYVYAVDEVGNVATRDLRVMIDWQAPTIGVLEAHRVDKPETDAVIEKIKDSVGVIKVFQGDIGQNAYNYFYLSNAPVYIVFEASDGEGSGVDLNTVQVKSGDTILPVTYDPETKKFTTDTIDETLKDVVISLKDIDNNENSLASKFSVYISDRAPSVVLDYNTTEFDQSSNEYSIDVEIAAAEIEDLPAEIEDQYSIFKLYALVEKNNVEGIKVEDVINRGSEVDYSSNKIKLKVNNDEKAYLVAVDTIGNYVGAPVVFVPDVTAPENAENNFTVEFDGAAYNPKNYPPKIDKNDKSENVCDAVKADENPITATFAVDGVTDPEPADGSNEAKATGVDYLYCIDANNNKIIADVEGENYVFKFKESQKGNVVFYAVDRAGNEAVIAERYIHINNEASTVTVDSVKYDNADYNGEWVKASEKNIEVTVSVIEGINSPGIDYVYCVEKGTNESTAEEDRIKVTEPDGDGNYIFTFSDEQEKEYEFFAVDKVTPTGNISEAAEKTVTIKIDNTDPQITDVSVKYRDKDYVGVDSEGNEKWVKAKDDPITVTVTAKDEGVSSGLAYVYYVDKNNNPVKKNGELIKGTPVADGIYTFTFDTDVSDEYKFIAVDNIKPAGNESAASEEVAVRIDNTDPVITKVEAKYNGKDYKGTRVNAETNPITVTVTVTDKTPSSGIDYVYYVDKNGDPVKDSDDNLIKGVAGAGGTYSFTFTGDVSDEYRFIAVDKVVDENGKPAGNESAQSEAVAINIDNTAPVITDVSVKYNGKDYTGDWVNADGKPITVTVTVEDSDPSSGIDYVYYVDKNGDPVKNENGDLIKGTAGEEGQYSFTFTDEVSDQFSFIAVDKVVDENGDPAGNESAPSEKVAINIDNTSPIITKVEYVNDDKWSNAKTAVVKVTVENKDVNSIGSIAPMAQVYFAANGANAEKADDHIKNITTDGTGTFTYEFTFTKEQEAEYTFFAKDKADNLSTASKEVKVKLDRTQPTLNSVTLNKELNKKNFGSFWHDIITAEVSLTDTPSADGNIQSGIEKVIMKAADGTEHVIIDGGKWVFSIPKLPETGNAFLNDVFYKAIKFTVIDNAGNSSTKTLSELSVALSDNLLEDTVAPVISDYKYEGPNKYTAPDGKRWYSGNVTGTVTFTDYAAQGSNKSASGFESASISTNGATTPYKITKDDTQSLKTLSLSVTSLTNDVAASTGAVDFNATVTDLAKNTTTAKTDTVYVDTIAPEITGITVNGKSVMGANNTYNISAFSNTASTVRIEANDPSGARSGASGVMSITYTLYDVNGSRVDGRTVTVTDGKSITFTIAPDFKGYITAYATDNVKNSDAVNKLATTNRFVLESNTKHQSEKHITISLPDTSITDIDGRPLYSGDIDAVVNITDDYSGIKSVSYEVIDRSGTLTPQSSLQQTASDINLMTGATQTLRITNDNNDIVLKVTMTDNAGNTATEEVNLSIDKTKPVIDVVYDNNNFNPAYQSETEYYNADRTATVTITERNFKDAEAIVNGITNSAGNAPVLESGTFTRDTANPDNSKYVATVRFTADADYTVDFDYTDPAGNQADHYGQDKFTVDKTDPVIEINLGGDVQNGKYFNDDVEVTVTVTEHNFDKNLISFSGYQPDNDNWTVDNNNADKHSLKFTLSEETSYSFAVNGADKARNIANEAVPNPAEFIIDKTNPVPNIEGVLNQKAYSYSDDVSVYIYADDENFTQEKINEHLDVTVHKWLRDGSYKDVTKDFDLRLSLDESNKRISCSVLNFPKEESFDGIYTIDLSLRDMANNPGSESVTFSVNRYGANFTIFDESTINEVLNQYLSQGRPVSLTAISVSPIANETITVVHDGEPRTLVLGQDYDRGLSRINNENNDTNNGWYRYDYVIRDSVFAEDGYYTLSISATDEAGNVSSSDDDAHAESAGEVSFFIDSVAPVVTITGAEDGVSYKESSKEITVTFEDKNLDVDNYQDIIHVLVNGKEVTNFDDITLGAGVITVKITVDDQDAEVEAYVTDMAGNEGTAEKLTFKLDQNWLQRFYNNHKGAFFGTIGGIAALIAFIIFLIIKKKKNDK